MGKRRITTVQLFRNGEEVGRSALDGGVPAGAFAVNLVQMVDRHTDGESEVWDQYQVLVTSEVVEVEEQVG